jgi:hypothetical protein
VWSGECDDGMHAGRLAVKGWGLSFAQEVSASYTVKLQLHQTHSSVRMMYQIHITGPPNSTTPNLGFQLLASTHGRRTRKCEPEPCTRHAVILTLSLCCACITNVKGYYPVFPPGFMPQTDSFAVVEDSQFNSTESKKPIDI